MIVKTSALTSCYGRIKAVDNINLLVPERSIFGFLGPNGAGKTTTIRLLLGLMRPDEAGFIVPADKTQTSPMYQQ